MFDVKICFCVDTMNSGGAERVVATLSNQFVKMGNDVVILMVAAETNKSFYELNDAVKLIALCEGFSNRVRPFKRVKLLRACLLREHPDVVISFLPNANIYASFALHRSDIPHIVSERNNPHVDPKNKLMRFLKKKAFARAQGCVFQTSAAKAYYSSKIQKKSTVIYNPISLQESIHRNIECKHYVLSVGRLTAQKNMGLLLETFARFQKEHIDYRLVIYGDGIERENLIAQAKNLRISDSVELRGNSPAWQQEAFDAMMFVLSSNYEGMPNALMEAMALGIPCISTDCPIGGPQELINDGVNGFLISVGNGNELYDKMNEIANSETIREKFAKENEAMRQKMSADQICSQWLNFIQKEIC